MVDATTNALKFYSVKHLITWSYNSKVAIAKVVCHITVQLSDYLN